MNSSLPFSYSQLRTFSECPRRYYFVYEQGIRLPPPFVIVEGSAYHRTLEDANRRLLESRALSARELVDHYVEHLETALQDEVLVEPPDVARSVAVAQVVLPVYHEGLYRELRPEAVEQRIDFEVGGFPFCGVIDLLEGGFRVIDYKIVGHTKQQEVVRRSPQLHLYARAVSRPHVAHVQLNRVTGRVVLTEAQLTPVVIENTCCWAADQARAIEVCRTTGVWPMAARDAWQCSPSSCGFYHVCYKQEDLWTPNSSVASTLPPPLSNDTPPSR